MDEVTKVMDAIAILQDSVLANIGDTEAMTRLEAREELPESMRSWIEMKKAEGDEPTPDPVDEPEPEPEPVSVEKGKPIATDYDDELEFARALIHWDTAKKVKADPATPYKKPVRESFASEADFTKANDAYNSFISEIKRDLTEEIGDAVKKSLAGAPAEPVEPADIKSFAKAADEARNFEDYLYRVGVES
mgnify:FL=1